MKNQLSGSKKIFQTRFVRLADLDFLFEMLVELVKYEGSYDRFKMTRERLEKELFGEDADWNCLVAVDEEEQMIGFCLYSFANINRAFNLSPMIQIDDLFVKPDYRRVGIGRLLLNRLALIANEKNIGRLNVWCMKENEAGQNFYKTTGAVKRDFVDIYSIAVNQLLKPTELHHAF